MGDGPSARPPDPADDEPLARTPDPAGGEPSTRTPDSAGDGPSTRTPDSAGDGPSTRTPDSAGDGPSTRTPDPAGGEPSTRTPDSAGDGPSTRTPDSAGDGPSTRTPDSAGDGPSTRTPDSAGDGPPNPSSCPADTIATHPSLGLGCIARQEFLLKAKEWSRDYRSEPGFRNQWGLGTINADRAYAHLRLLEGGDAEPGEGVTIGFVDTGIDRDHPSFADTAVTESFLNGATDETGDRHSHGTWVASVAAGDRVSDPDAHHGVAWGADIAMFAIPSNPPRYQPASLAQLNSRDLDDSGLFKFALGERIDILNVTMGFDGNIEDYSKKQIRTNYARTIAALAQETTKEKTILVWSTGNNHGRACSAAQVGAKRCVNGRVNASSPKLWPGLPSRIAELRGHSIAVAAINQDGSIANYSNRCGIAADYCIVAPGTNVRSADFGPANGVNGVRGWTFVLGTSFAAPMVSGGLAIMKQLFRDQLSNTDLVSRLFATADKTGIYADRSTYGQGLLDLGAATNPWGTATFIRPGQTVAQQDGRAGVAGSAIRPSRALGDSFIRALGQREVAAFDELGAPFWFAASDFVRLPPRSAAPARPDRLFADSEDSVRSEDGAWRLDVRPPGRFPGHLALAGGAARFDLSTPYDWSAAFFHRPQEGGSRPLSGFAAEWRPADLSTVALQAGWLAEPDSLLGSSAAGAFGRLAGRTAFLSARLEADGPPGWRLTAQGELGAVRPDSIGGPLIRDISTLRTSAFRVAAAHTISPAGTTVRFAVEQPIRVTEGVAVLDLPTGRTVGGRVVGETVGVGLAPTGRQLDLSARIDHVLAGGALAFELVWSRQPGHRADAPSEWTVRTGWKKRF